MKTGSGVAPNLAADLWQVLGPARLCFELSVFRPGAGPETKPGRTRCGLPDGCCREFLPKHTFALAGSTGKYNRFGINDDTLGVNQPGDFHTPSGDAVRSCRTLRPTGLQLGEPPTAGE